MLSVMSARETFRPYTFNFSPSDAGVWQNLCKYAQTCATKGNQPLLQLLAAQQGPAISTQRSALVPLTAGPAQSNVLATRTQMIGSVTKEKAIPRPKAKGNAKAPGKKRKAENQQLASGTSRVHAVFGV